MIIFSYCNQFGFLSVICGVKPMKRREPWIDCIMIFTVMSDRLLKPTDRYKMVNSLCLVKALNPGVISKVG